MVAEINVAEPAVKEEWLHDVSEPAKYNGRAQRAIEVAIVSHAARSTHRDEMTNIPPGLESPARDSALAAMPEGLAASVLFFKGEYAQATRWVMPLKGTNDELDLRNSIQDSLMSSGQEGTQSAGDAETKEKKKKRRKKTAKVAADSCFSQFHAFKIYHFADMFMKAARFRA